MLSKKIIVARIHDVIMAGVAMLLALGARYGFQALPDQERVVLWIAVCVGVAAVVFHLFGLGRGMWRFASVTDLRVIVLASAATILGFLVVMFLVNRLEGLPRTAPVIAWFVMVVLLGAPRLAFRVFKDKGLRRLWPDDASAAHPAEVLIIGGPTDADRVIRAYGLESSSRYRVRGIVDYTPKRRGSNLRGIPILGDLSELDDILSVFSGSGVAIEAAILAGPNETHEGLSSLPAAVARWQLPLRRVSTAPLTGGDPDLESVRLEDLLGRPSVELELDRIRSLVSGKVIAVTGAGGSIGAEIVRQVAALGPSRLVMIDLSEYALYEIGQAVGRRFGSVPRRAVIADVRDRTRIAALFEEERPAIVFHAAALKHVPIVEENVGEGVLTNVIGTRNVADAAVAADADAMVLISTDKAVRPSSVMGASKRAAESYCQAVDVSGARTRFITVRFGNVLGSAGSVVPLFKEQILRGGPVTVTHPDMRRYFMTLKEATELVLQSAATGIDRADQRGAIFVLDMGDPVKITDLARTLIVLAGLRPEQDIPIVFTGPRPGEKLFEELFDDNERSIASGADGVFVASARLTDLDRITAQILDLECAARISDETALRALLARTVPEFSPGGRPAAARVEATAGERVPGGAAARHLETPASP